MATDDARTRSSARMEIYGRSSTGSCAAVSQAPRGRTHIDHLRWLPTEGLTPETATLRDLQRYMGLIGAEYRSPYGGPWRVGKRPFAASYPDPSERNLELSS